MTCPDCFAARTSVVKTVVAPGSTQRLRSCPCGAEFWTAERLLKLCPATAGQPPPNRQATAPQLTGNRSVIIGGTVGGSESPVLDLVPIPSGVLEAKSVTVLRKRRKGRGDAIAYPPEFEALWSNCTGRRGNKDPAFKAWSRHCPSAELVIERYSLWSQTDGWRRGFVPHLSTWLNRLGWQDVPSAAELAGPDDSAVRSAPAPKSWLAQQNDRALEESMAESRRRKASQ